MPVRKAQGFALIDLIFVCGIIGLLCSIAVPRLFMAQQSAGAASAVGSMRVINSSQLTYALTCGAGFYAPNLTTLGIADSIVKSGYNIQMAATPYPGSPGSCNGLGVGLSGQGFAAAADPLEPSNPRYFATNASNIIYEHTSSLFATMPETGAPPAGQMIVR